MWRATLFWISCLRIPTRELVLQTPSLPGICLSQPHVQAGDVSVSHHAAKRPYEVAPVARMTVVAQYGSLYTVVNLG
jgi:hypothetical protein